MIAKFMDGCEFRTVNELIPYIRERWKFMMQNND